MKKILFCLMAILIVSCKQEAPVDYAVISGKIINKDGNEITISNSDRTVNETIKIANDGSFVDTLKVKPASYFLYDGKNRSFVYLDSGINLNVNFDAKNFEKTLKFSGTGFEVSEYLRLKANKEKELMGEGTEVYKLEEDAYKAKFNQIKDEISQLIKTTEKISENYKTNELKNLNYEYLNKLNIYQLYHSHYAKKPDFKISEGFLNELNGMDYGIEEDYLFSVAYKSLVSSHYGDKGAELAKTEEIERDVAMLAVASEIENLIIKNTLLYENSVYNITYTNDLEAFYAAFMAGSTDDKHRKEITESYNKMKSVAKGQPSPKFVNYENFAGGTTSLDDLKGKFVYVDVWATWCGPCKREIPFLKEVEKKYHGKKIEFVSMSVDRVKDYDAWRKMIEEKELGGVQLFADKDWNSDFVKDYMIKGIPRFILIDPEGKIVSSNAPRPSSEELIKMFDENNI